MNIIRKSFSYTHLRLAYRTFGNSPVLEGKKWRLENGLSANRNAEGFLTDGPDYTFLDGRPTPLLHKQKKRFLRQREIASQIVELNSELQFAKDRYQNILKSKQEERQSIIDGRLKPKGRELMKHK